MSKAQEHKNWLYEQKCQAAVKMLAKHDFTAVYCASKEEALEYIRKEANEARVIATGGSITLSDLNIKAILTQMGKEVITLGHNPSLEEKFAVYRRQLTCDLFLLSANAVTLSGCLVNIDGTGNRVAASIFGPRKVIVVAGRNKLVADVDEALKKIKNHIAPANCRNLQLKNPCAVTGCCSDCDSPARSCRVTVIMERKPRLSDVHILVVNEDMGL